MYYMSLTSRATVACSNSCPLFFASRPYIQEIYSLAIIQYDSPVEPIAMRMVALENRFSFPEGTSAGSMYGHPCATTAISVAAINWVRT